ncbi:MAG TPA: hypothetical protein VMW52_01050 [Phycisphaerae bacterium]|nr:hypothetical protein [Phycisphaerae bacterium]
MEHASIIFLVRSDGQRYGIGAGTDGKVVSITHAADDQLCVDYLCVPVGEFAALLRGLIDNRQKAIRRGIGSGNENEEKANV